MPRTNRIVIPHIPVHVIHRGINRAECFLDQGDFQNYWRLMLTHARAASCAIHAYVLMTNHVHLLVTPDRPASLATMMKPLAQLYAHKFNFRYGRTGPLWEGRYKVRLIMDERYLLTCYRYIELNPVRAGMCRSPADYVWSSYRCNAAGVADDVVTPHSCYAALNKDESMRRLAYQGLFAEAISDRALTAIRGG